jgi:hypothetical protein
MPDVLKLITGVIETFFAKIFPFPVYFSAFLLMYEYGHAHGLLFLF